MPTYHLTITHTSRVSVNVDAEDITAAIELAPRYVKGDSIIKVEADLIEEKDEDQ